MERSEVHFKTKGKTIAIWLILIYLLSSAQCVVISIQEAELVHEGRDNLGCFRQKVIDFS